MKPTQAIYEHCLAGLGVRPHEALFLDDRSPNIEAAQDLEFMVSTSQTMRLQRQPSKNMSSCHHLSCQSVKPAALLWPFSWR